MFPMRLLNFQAENKQMHIEMNQLKVVASMDGLTGISNKTTALKLIQQRIAKGGAFFIIDIDNFKNINDTYGHKKGDSVIKTISDAVKESFRENDIVARFGGDEFIVFLQKEYATRSLVKKKASELCRNCRKLVSADEKDSCYVTISVGVAFFSANSNLEFRDIFESADRSLYESKNAGKNRYTIHELY